MSVFYPLEIPDHVAGVKSPRRLILPNLRDRELLLSEGVGFILQEKLDYMEGNHYLLFYATEKV